MDTRPEVVLAWEYRRMHLVLAASGATVRGDMSLLLQLIDEAHQAGIAIGAYEMRAEMKDEAHR